MNIILVDDSTPIRTRVKKMLTAIPGVVVVSEACNGEEALTVICKYLPQIVILDIYMPKKNGFDVLKILRSKYPKMKIIIFTNYSNIKTVRHALELGADHVFDKSTEFEMLIQLVRLHSELIM